MRRTRETGARTGPGPRQQTLRVWEKSFTLAVAIFKMADKIPESLGIKLNGQMRIAALSVPSQLARCRSRVSNREFLMGLCTAYKALRELDGHVQLCSELGYATELEVRIVGAQIHEVRHLTSIVIRRLRAVVRDGLSPQALSEEIASLVSGGSAARNEVRS